ncbi:hypothetical protein DPMN_148073 [Dreissena polymorpha]|uniref:Uncharacterized protein n=1 Tax=Dreissena polymorpha TaxID=45954 RepID=A0A9D4FEV3_DREPO|nr:hypothetical protein DPMN_148073 [Dreissena polymorpha]
MSLNFTTNGIVSAAPAKCTANRCARKYVASTPGNARSRRVTTDYPRISPHYSKSPPRAHPSYIFNVNILSNKHIYNILSALAFCSSATPKK